VGEPCGAAHEAALLNAMSFRNCIVSALLGVALACQKPPGVDAAPQTSPAASALGPAARSRGLRPALAVAPGPWRKAAPEDLARLVLWPAHLLVRYDGVIDHENVAFKMAAFHSVLPPPTRSRDEALALARQLARAAREAPERFGEFVRQHSEDIVTRESGGSLGGVPADQLMPWPEVLDALTALAPGEVSDVVETWYGFHVFQRRAAPPPDTVTGRRIVIAHDQARFLSALRDGSQPARSRGEAFALAQQLYERARAAPHEFHELVQAYSELPDRIVGGDFGTWSNRELTPFPREVEALSQLAVGQVAPPMDSLFGIEIVMRVANPARVVYALDGLQLPFDPGAPEGDSQSRAHVQAEALRLNEALRQDPTQLAVLSQRHTPYRDQWFEGRGLPAVTVAVREIEIGQGLRAPATVGNTIVVGRRIAPSTPEPIAALSELPGTGGG